ncbi:hypothetical protein [Corynebacterium aquatimens]|uniref:Uncharacterized protein n=1 Tax=Corynebacterium aquatimens TaxID=1190508 RepID=A0A931E3U6_9CORY|nr:hypothetical protein [Corynebacterium aquatimens]MBG6123130.1 hypothetical protein [Corynebacterium aquatimens]WJY66538.1 hypothetical protein CAQUA_09255 [Corynebacterium aquatimens]
MGVKRGKSAMAVALVVGLLAGCSGEPQGEKPDENVASNHPVVTESPLDEAPDSVASSVAPEAGEPIPDGTYRSDDGKVELIVEGQMCSLNEKVCRVDPDRSVLMRVENAKGDGDKDVMPYTLEGDTVKISNIGGDSAQRVLTRS